MSSVVFPVVFFPPRNKISKKKKRVYKEGRFVTEGNRERRKESNVYHIEVWRQEERVGKKMEN